MYATFQDLMEKKNVTATEVSRQTGIARSIFTDWKMGRSNPKQDKLQKIADYFDVSLEYLMTGKKDETKFSKKEIDLIDLYRNLTIEQQEEVHHHIDMLCRLKKYKELIDEQSNVEVML